MGLKYNVMYIYVFCIELLIFILINYLSINHSIAINFLLINFTQPLILLVTPLP